MIRVFTDTAANLPPEVLEKYHIRTLPLTYRVDGELPEGEFDGPAYYDAIRGGAEVKTAMVNPQDTAEGMEPVLAAGDDLLYIGISGGISGTCWSVGLAADELMAKYPGRQLRVIDSRGASLGEGLIPIEVAKRAQAGATMEELVECVRSMRSRMQQFFVVDDLKYLHKGGRISGGAKLAGTILNIKPILQSDEEGKIILRSKVRGKKKAVEVTVDTMEQHAQGGRDYDGKCFVCHSDCPEDARMTIQAIEDRFPKLKGKIRLCDIGTIIGSHAGPGTVAAFFLGDERPHMD
mgnify:CR=1 FL=1